MGEGFHPATTCTKALVTQSPDNMQTPTPIETKTWHVAGSREAFTGMGFLDFVVPRCSKSHSHARLRDGNNNSAAAAEMSPACSGFGHGKSVPWIAVAYVLALGTWRLHGVGGLVHI